MPNTKVILFTSTNRPCRYIISALLALSDSPVIRVITRPVPNVRESFPPQLCSTPHSIILADHLESPDSMLAFRGVDIIFHDGVPVHPNEVALSATVIDAAKAVGVQHFILLSVFHPMRTKIRTHLTKLGIEEYLVESRLNYTILQPAHYMQNVDLQVALRTSRVLLGFSSSVPHGFIDLVDVAAVTVKIISDPSTHNFARYELVAENLTYDDIADKISRLSGTQVQCEVIPAKDFLALMNTGGDIRNEYTEDAIIRIMIYYDRWGLLGNHNILKWLLCREPTSWEAYLQRELRNSSQ